MNVDEVIKEWNEQAQKMRQNSRRLCNEETKKYWEGRAIGLEWCAKELKKLEE